MALMRARDGWTKRMKLILFDIDGTLLNCGGRTRVPLAGALEQTWGTAGSLLEDPFAGKTDDQIVFDALTSGGVDEREIARLLPLAKARYIAALESALDGADVVLLPGVEETLERLGALPGVRIGLLTGNWEVGARWKLDHFDLNRFFGVGAFGDGCRDRAGLPPVALEVAGRHFGERFGPEDALIVGDTPNDVRCGRENKIGVVALTTGFSSGDELREAGADWIFGDLIEAEYLLPIVQPPRVDQRELAER